MKLGVSVATFVHGDDTTELLVDKEVLLSWTELLKKFSFCFPDVPKLDRQTTWEVYQHAIQEDDRGQRCHYWGTDTRYSHSSRDGLRRRRDFIRVKGEHLCQIVGFVQARYPSPTVRNPNAKAGKSGVLVRWLTPHAHAVMQNGVPMCAGQLQNTHRLWSWHLTESPRTAISGYWFGRLPPVQKRWLEPRSKRDGLLRASYDVLEFETLGKYANVTADFDSDGFLESESWA